MDVLFSCDVATLQQPIQNQHQLITVHRSAKDTAVLLVWKIWPHNSPGFSTQGPTSRLHEGKTVSKLLPLNCQQEGSGLYFFFFATGSQLFQQSSFSLPPHALSVLLCLPPHCFCSATSQKKPASSIPNRRYYPKRRENKQFILYIWYAKINLWTYSKFPPKRKCLGWIMSNWRQ